MGPEERQAHYFRLPAATARRQLEIRSRAGQRCVQRQTRCVDRVPGWVDLGTSNFPAVRLYSVAIRNIYESRYIEAQSDLEKIRMLPCLAGR